MRGRSFCGPVRLLRAGLRPPTPGVSRRRALTAGTRPIDTGKIQLLQRKITDLRRRQSNLVDRLEDEEGSDPDLRAEYQRRFVEYKTDIQQAQDELSAVQALQADRQGDPALLCELPQLGGKVSDLPEPLRRKLFDVFQLKITYSRDRNVAVIQIVISTNAIEAVTQAAQRRKGTNEVNPVNEVQGGSSTPNGVFAAPSTEETAHVTPAFRLDATISLPEPRRRRMGGAA